MTDPTSTPPAAPAAAAPATVTPSHLEALKTDLMNEIHKLEEKLHALVAKVEGDAKTEEKKL